MNRLSRSRSRGFSLLEALVALVILASAGWALFDWINASVVALGRVEEANARSAASTNAVEFMQSVNPMLRPEGEMDLGDYRVQWRASAITTPIDGSDYPRGRSAFQLALYDTVVRAYRRTDDKPWFEVRLKQVGYKRVREAFNPFQP